MNGTWRDNCSSPIIGNLCMNIDEMIFEIKESEIIGSVMVMNYIYLDGRCYVLSDAVTNAQMNFCDCSISKIEKLNYSVYKDVDKKSKRIMDKRITFRFENGKSITIEYNDHAKFEYSEELSNNYHKSIHSMFTLLGKNDKGKFERVDGYSINILGEIMGEIE